MKRMTLAEKIGQMVQIEREVATPDVMTKYLIGKLVQFTSLIIIVCYPFCAN